MLRIRTSSVVQYYKYVFGELADPRTNNWFLISSPIPGLIIIYLYLQFVTKWGPRYMANKPPFQLQKTLVVYNFLQVCVSCWIVYEGLDAAWLRHYSLKCQPVDFSNSHEGMRAARCVYIYFLAKITELLDTVFFVLRKKDRQITFLHLYHHAAMPMISWGATKYYPGGHGTFIGLVNSFVHIFMYAYYMVAALGPEYQRKLNWWKRQITTLQMVQFCLTFLHSSQLLFYDCGFPRWTLVFTLPNSIFFYYLFYDFYYKAYKTPKADAEKNAQNGIKLQRIREEYEEKIGNVANGIQRTAGNKYER
ncbi:elongation of very long chain fatty acids protein AAEL008004-like isoform X2 [Cydia pomonella]|uniref:elongation of very long chain fatty acids protein AAEL008004-like isoform X2 n=1 Tax=Cydia pomonella TaxID=82600 RepID=UPI002ADDBEA0|nr:elongation of very long chain fatty acids protein AAEL008004-like isoform X2 [Cydia pomonella]